MGCEIGRCVVEVGCVGSEGGGAVTRLQLIVVRLERLLDAAVLHRHVAELRRRVALRLRQDHLVERLVDGGGDGDELALVAKVAEGGVLAPERDAHQHVEELVQHELLVLLRLLAVVGPLHLLDLLPLERLVGVGDAVLRRRLHPLLVRLRRVRRVRFDELVAHHVELVLLRLEADVDHEVVELVHRHLHRVRRAVLRDRAAVREEDRRELAEERLHAVVGR